MVDSGRDSLFNKAKEYSSLKYILSLLGTVYLLILLFLFAGSGLSKVLAERIFEFTSVSYFVVPLYILIISLAYYLLDFPLNIYRSYFLEHKFRLSNQKFSDWLIDQFKAGVVSYVISLILIQAFYFILKSCVYFWWLVISLFWVIFSFILAKLAPVVIIPLFFKYKKISDELLRKRIMKLAKSMGIRILDVFEIDFSKKTLKANAAFVGWGKTRRVLLADTLKDKYSHDEIEVILAHEFAHYKLRHLLKLILLNSTVTVILFYFISKTSDYVLSLFGMQSLSDIAALPVVLIYLTLFAMFMQPLENFISRRLEKNADAMALSVSGLKEAFISMMEKLAKQNLADRNPHPIIKFFFFDHPPVDERIALAKAT